MGYLQGKAIRVLVVEDVKADAERMLYQFHRAGVPVEARLVDTEEGLVDALEQFAPSIVLSDFTLPRFDGMSALQICLERAPEVPFVFVSGTIGEERAVAALQAGAADYVLKDNVTRLVPAAQRALGDARARAERASEQAQIARLNRILRMLKGVNEMVMRCRDRAELLDETCRLAVSLGGYAMALAAVRGADGASIRVLASHGGEESMTAWLRACAEDGASSESVLLDKVLCTGREFICHEPAGAASTGSGTLLMPGGAPGGFVILPLMADQEPGAALMLVARDPDLLGEEELGVVRELAHSLSFGLQYMQRDIHVRFLAHFHPVTGLARRALFCDRVRDLLAGTAAGKSGHAVVVLDVRRLGAINDSFGRHLGDRLLRQVAEALKRQFGQPERLAHFGGGTFAVILQKPSGPARTWQEKIQRQAAGIFNLPLQVDRRSIPLSMRLGCALYPDDSGEPHALVQQAETALLIARAAGQSAARFDPAVKMQSVGNLALEHRLRFALERKQFELHYQPKVNVITRRIQGAEALLRWRCPEQGLVLPESFLPVLESSGLIVEVGNWVVEQAARDCAGWKEARLPPLRVAVNIAPAQLRMPDFERSFLAALHPWASRTRRLDIEITEGLLQDDCADEIRKLARLRRHGVRIAIDDFGTGYSSLSRLSELPVDTLKLDQRFIRQIVRNPTGACVVRTMVSLARAFNLTSVAEGVEKQEELDQLWHFGCDQSQGFLHCPPLPAGQFAAVVREGRGVLMQPPESESGPEEPEAAGAY